MELGSYFLFLQEQIKDIIISRKKLVMIRKGQPQESPDVTEEESAPVGRPRAEQGGDDPLIAPQMSHSEPWLSCVDWQRKWEMSLGRAAVEGHRSLGSFRETTAAWLREQGDWNGS